MDGDQTAEDCQNILNQIRLDHLLRGLGPTVLRRKFKEIYAKLNGGKEWTDSPETGEKFIRSKWGNPAFVNAQGKQREMMEGGNIQNWDLYCLQSVITQMLTTALQDSKPENHRSDWSLKKKTTSNGQGHPVNWDRRWGSQMANVRQLANIRNDIAHMPNETLSQEEFDDKWKEAVVAIKGLGAKQKEIDKILKSCQAAVNVTSSELPGQGQVPGQMLNGQKNQSSKTTETSEEERSTMEELSTKCEELQLGNQSKVKVKDEKDEVKGQLTNKNGFSVVCNKKNESKVKALARRGDSAGISGDWDKALEFYNRALEIPEISDDLQRKIYLNRSWVRLKILQMPESKPRFHYETYKLEESECEVKNVPITNGKPGRNSRFKDEKILDIDFLKWPEKLTQEVKEFHLTAGIADAKSALQLAPDQKCPKAFYRLAQFHQLKGDWSSALTFFDLALNQSDLDDNQLEFDRNVCQLEVLNQVEVEEFNWIPGKENQTMAGLFVTRNPQRWSQAIKTVETTSNGDILPQQVGPSTIVQFLKAHFLAQGLSWEDQGQDQKTLEGQEVTNRPFDQVLDLYEEVVHGGLPTGLYNVGLLLQEGNGIQRDFIGAVHLFKTVAHMHVDDQTPVYVTEGVLEAQYRLGLCYEFGLGVGKDERRALHWYDTASGGNYAKASRRLGDIYSQGLLGVAKDTDMAFFCWEHAKQCGDLVAVTSASLASLHRLRTLSVTWLYIRNCLFSFSSAINRASYYGTPTMMAALLKGKQDFQDLLAATLQKLIQPEESEFGSEENPENEREPKEASWNVPAFVQHTLHIIHLLELVQTTEFQQKLGSTPDWSANLVFTGKLVEASNASIDGLAALQELNKLYRNELVKANGDRLELEIDYPPDLGSMSGVDQVTLEREAQLVAIIFASFANSLRWVGATFFRDRSIHELVYCLAKKTCIYAVNTGARMARTLEEMAMRLNAFFILFYLDMLKESETDGEKGLEEFEAHSWKRGDPLIEPMLAISGAAVKASLGKIEKAAGDMEEALQQTLRKDPILVPFLVDSKSDLFFVQAVCVKSAALTRGVNSANRKMVKEAMDIFNHFLSICPKDDPRRAEAHYQLALCTLYLERMKARGQSPAKCRVKGQGSLSSSVSKGILAKVLPHFTKGEAAEKDLPWRDQFSYTSPIKLVVEQKIQGLKNSVKKIPSQNLTSNLEKRSARSENTSFGRFLDPYFKFPTSSFHLKLREARRIRVIKQFRKLFKAAYSEVTPGSSIPFCKLDDLLKVSGSPYNGVNVCMVSSIVGCYEIVEPMFHCRVPDIEHPEVEQIVAFTVVQDESGAVYNFKFTIKHHADKTEAGKLGAFHLGGRIIVYRPLLVLDVEGGTNLFVQDAAEQVFHLPSTSISKEHEERQINGGQVKTRKCGFCGKIGESLKPCAECHMVYYCGKECQTAEWKELKHSRICPFLKEQLAPSSTFPVEGF